PDKPACKPFVPAAECLPMTLPVKPLKGDRQLVISSLAIAAYNEGFDLNCDGKVDNKLAPIGAVANSSIDDSFKLKHDIVLPLEFFGYQGKDSACTKFAFYLGRATEDSDGDGVDTSWVPDKSDCDDTNPNVFPKNPVPVKTDGGVVQTAQQSLTSRVDED